MLLTTDDLSFTATSPVSDIAACYSEHGCAVIRGLAASHASAIAAAIAAATADAQRLYAAGAYTTSAEGHYTSDGSLFLPRPHGSQLMTLGLGYHSSAAMLQAAIDTGLVRIATAILGADVELMDDGQVVTKAPSHGHAKRLHQDAAYFEHAGPGPLAALAYLVDTSFTNGSLHVVPGSHRHGLLPHIDTDSHLGLAEHNLDQAVEIPGNAGDVILFHQYTIHGSPENHSQTTRPVCIHRYRQIGDRVIAGGTTTANRSSHAADNKHAGLVVAGRRQQLGA